MWATDATTTVVVAEGQATAFSTADRLTAEGVGMRGAKRWALFQALKQLRRRRGRTSVPLAKGRPGVCGATTITAFNT